jgi:hypothetical protein
MREERREEEVAEKERENEGGDRVEGDRKVQGGGFAT